MKRLGGKIFCLVVCSIFLCCFFSCDALQDEGEEYSENDDTSLAKVIVRGYFVVGVLDWAPPCAFSNSEGRVVGFDVDIFNEVASRLDLEVRFKIISWAEKDAYLNSGEIDCIASAFTFSKERALRYSLTVPTLYNAQVAVVRGDSTIKKFSDLENRKTGYLAGSSISDIFTDGEKGKNRYKNVVAYPSFLVALDDLKLHVVDTVFMDILIANYIMKKNQNSYRILDEALSSEKYVYAFRRGDKLLKNSIEKVMLEMEYEGLVLELSKKWFGGDVYLFGR